MSQQFRDSGKHLGFKIAPKSNNTS